MVSIILIIDIYQDDFYLQVRIGEKMRKYECD